MAKSPADIEQKVSNETLPLPAPLVYTSPVQFEGNIYEMKGGADIEQHLMSATVLRRLERLKAILQTCNISINVRLQDGCTLLMLAGTFNNFRMVDFLLNEPKINISLVDKTGATAFSCALKTQYKFEHTDFEIIRRLIEAGANVNQKDQHGHTPLLHAWSCGNQEAANQLILLAANIDENEHLFNTLLAADGFGWTGCEGVPQQIALSKQHAVYLERARQLGLSIGDVCFQFMEHDKRIGREIGEFLFDGVGTAAFNTGCEMAFQALSKQFPAPEPKELLPIPRSLSFMPYFSSLMSQASSGSRLLPEKVVSDLRLLQQQAGYQADWQRWQETYHDNDENYPLRKQPGYGPGAMVVYKP